MEGNIIEEGNKRGEMEIEKILNDRGEEVAIIINDEHYTFLHEKNSSKSIILEKDRVKIIKNEMLNFGKIRKIFKDFDEGKNIEGKRLGGRGYRFKIPRSFKFWRIYIGSNHIDIWIAKD